MVIVSAENEPIRGHRELIVEKYLDKLGITYKANPVYCFRCKDYFPYGKRDLPEKCPIGSHQFSERGEFCIPDFVLLNPVYSPATSEYELYIRGNRKLRSKPIAVIMVNEAIHYKNKRKMSQLAGQVSQFLDMGIAVFPISEEEIDKASELQLTGMMYYISHAANNRTMFEYYKDTNEFKEKTASFYVKCGR